MFSVSLYGVQCFTNLSPVICSRKKRLYGQIQLGNTNISISKKSKRVINELKSFSKETHVSHTY